MCAEQKIIRETHFGRVLQVYAQRPHSLTEMLNQSVSHYPDRECLVLGETRISYRKFAQKVNVLAHNLSNSWQVNKGDRVALLLGNVIEFCISIFALAQIGAITVPLNTRLKGEELKFMLKDSGAKMLITEKEYWECIEVAQKELGDLREIFMIETTSLPPGVKPFAALFQKEPSGTVSVPCHEDDPVFIMYTSGTTGLPKGAIGTHLGMIHSVISYKLRFDTNELDRTLLVVPLFHVTGLIGQFFHMIYVGGTTVLMKSYKTEPMIQLMEKEKITFSFAVPTIYVLMLLHPNLNQYDLGSLRLAAYGGAPMSLQTIRQLSERFPKLDLRNAYGATETSSPATIMPYGESMRKSSPVGLPVPVGELKVVGDQDRVLGANEVGELLIKGPMVVPGYWNNEKANQKEFADGYWRSGDLARIDEENFVYIMDRKKDMINRGGEKIFCVEVEDVLYSHPKVLEASVVGLPDEVFGEQVKAVIVPRPGEVITDEEIRNWVSQRLADYKTPKFVCIVDELPRNPGGKVIKSQVRDL